MNQGFVKSTVQQLGCEEEISAISRAYRSQIDCGNSIKTALVLATIVYLQRNPKVPAVVARARVAATVGAVAA